jgi:hypothetical protein
MATTAFDAAQAAAMHSAHQLRARALVAILVIAQRFVVLSPKSGATMARARCCR